MLTNTADIDAVHLLLLAHRQRSLVCTWIARNGI